MNDAKVHIHKWGNNMTWTIGFFLNRCKWELPDQHIAHCILPPELSFNILIISTVCSYEVSYRQSQIPWPSSTTIPLSSTKPSSSFSMPWSVQHIYYFRCVVYNMSWGPAYARHTSKSVWRVVTLVAIVTDHQHISVNLPRHLLQSTLHLLLGGDGLGL